MRAPTLKRCCGYGDPEFCIQAIVSVLLHHGPEFLLTVLKSSIDHISRQLVRDSPMHARFQGLAAQLDAVLAASESLSIDSHELN
jgi:hypothetical protein